MNQNMHEPQICFGQVRHHRLRPAVNAFQYGVYFMRLPLRTMERDEFEPLFCSRNRFNLLSFHDADHGDGQQPLVEWIDALLKSEGILDANGEIWLQTFPRVLGYVFNPVSFWFCHKKNGALRAVLCEVRNTFGERHCYLLDTGSDMPYGIELTAKKVFHVSPFCPIAGGYRFRFMRSSRLLGDQESETTIARIDYDDADGPLLLTSITGKSVVLSDGAIAKAFFNYPLMTFGVVAKIHWQALRLWLKRVPFFSKPAIPQHEVTR
ncbi:MAG: DUF1365 domain-containing protein [Burkholderiaceae bacterium]